MKGISFALLGLALVSCGALAEMSANDAFNEGNSFGVARNAEVRDGVSTSAAEDTVSNYSSTSERSALYGGMTNLAPFGTNEKVYCQTEGLSAPDSRQREACNATNMLSNLREHAPEIIINRETDPLMIRKREVLADPVAATGMPFATSLSECSAEAVTSSDITRTETCFDGIPLPSSASCQMPWEVEVVQHNRYACLSGKKSTVHNCQETLLVSCTGGGEGCESSGIVPGSVYLTNGTYAFSLSGSTLTLRNNVTAVNSTTYARFNVQVAGLERVTNFHLSYVHSDNWMGLEINGVHVATHSRALGGLWTTPATDRLEHFWDDGEFFRRSMVRICPTCVYNAETGHNYASTHNFDVRPYLREGVNTFVMYVVNGGGPGYGEVRFRVQQNCPVTCVGTWDRGACAAFR